MLQLRDTNGNETAVVAFNIAITDTLDTLSTLSFNFVVDPNNIQDPNRVASQMMLPRTLVTDPKTGKVFRLLTQNPTTLGKKKLYAVMANSVGVDLHDNYVETKLLATQSLVACMNYITNGTKFKYVIDGSFSNYSFSEGFGGAYADDLLGNLSNDFGFEYYFDNYTIHIAKTIGKDNSFLFVDRSNCAKIAINEDYSTIRTHIKGYGKQNDDGSYAATAEYTSPLADSPYNWGKMDNEPYQSDSITNYDTLLATIKANIHDYPDIQYSLEYVNFKKNVTGFNNDLTVGNSGWLRDRFGIDVSVRLQSITYYPQDTKNAGTITFGNKIFDPILWQQKLRKDYQANKTLGQSLKNEIAALNQYYTTLNGDNETNQKAIAEMQSKINELQSNGIFVDVSSNNTDTSVEWFTKLVNYGAKGLMVKLTQSTDYVNPLAATQITNGETAGLSLVGCYHYFMGDGTAEGQAFLAQLRANNVSTTALVVLDIEDDTLNPIVVSPKITKEELAIKISDFYEVLSSAGYSNSCNLASTSVFKNWINTDSKYKWTVNYGTNAKPENTDAWKFDSNWKGLKVGANYAYNSIFI